MKFIHAIDIHLDSPFHRLEEYEGAPVDEFRQATRRAFENLIDLANDETVDFVLIAGDLRLSVGMNYSVERFLN